MIVSMNERARFYEEMALRNEQAALRAVTTIQYLRYSRMQYRYLLRMNVELLRHANRIGAEARRSVMKQMSYYAGHYKRYDRLHKGMCHASHS